MEREFIESSSTEEYKEIAFRRKEQYLIRIGAKRRLESSSIEALTVYLMNYYIKKDKVVKNKDLSISAQTIIQEIECVVLSKLKISDIENGNNRIIISYNDLITFYKKSLNKKNQGK